MTLDLDNPKFRTTLERLRRINDANELPESERAQPVW